MPDGVIPGARAGIWTESVLQGTLRQLKHAYVVGTVLNDIDSKQFQQQYGDYVVPGYAGSLQA